MTSEARRRECMQGRAISQALLKQCRRDSTGVVYVVYVKTTISSVGMMFTPKQINFWFELLIFFSANIEINKHCNRRKFQERNFREAKNTRNF